MFQNKYLSVIAYANGYTLWHYGDRKTKYEDLDLTKFFDPIYTLCMVGDKIMISLQDVYLEAVIVKIHSGNVICKELTHIKYDIDEPSTEEEEE